jgi:Kef-type K+ transport system membrane component KefB
MRPWNLTAMWADLARQSDGSATGILPLLLALAIILLAAKLFASLALRLGQPAVLGELLAGLVLGPSLLNFLSLSPLRDNGLEHTLHLLAELGVIVLMFSAGLEIDAGDLARSGRPAALAGVMGVVFPLVLGSAVALAFGMSPTTAVFTGIVLSATSVSISAQTLLELGRLSSREGITLLGAAVVDDILVIAVLAVFLGLVGGAGGWGVVALQLARMLAVLLLVTAAALWVYPRWVDKVDRLRASQGLLALSLAAALAISWVTEYAGGIAAITGAFLAGVGLSRSHLREEIAEKISPLAYGFLVPLFLVDVGLRTDLGRLDAGGLGFAVVVVAVAAISKVVGSGWGARLGGLDRPSALRLGVGMISRGEVGLIVAGVGLAQGLLPERVFSIAVVMVFATTLMTPPLLRWTFARTEVRHAERDQPGDLRPGQDG